MPAAGLRPYRESSHLLGEPGAWRLFSALGRHPRITRLWGIRGMAGPMGEGKVFLREMLRWPALFLTASRFAHDVFERCG